MDVPKVPPRQAVDQLQAVLDSPEVRELISWLEAVRWTGRPGYPIRAMIGMCFVKTMYGLNTWSRTVRLVADHPGLQELLECVPSQWACYRFAKQLRTRDSAFLQKCIGDVLTGLHEQHPTMGENVAIDASDLPAYANGKRTNKEDTRKPSDRDASWGYRSAVSTRSAGTFYGFKIDACVDIATGLPVVWDVRTAGQHEDKFAVPLVDQAKHRGFDVQTVSADKGYDADEVHFWLRRRDVVPIIPLKETGRIKRGAAEPPHCVHGEWRFAGADYQRKATKWRCPTGECEPKSVWVDADRLHPLIPRNSKRWRHLYGQRARVEGEFGNLKHEWSLLPLRVRGLASVRLHADLTILAKLASRLTTERSALTLAT